jgi:hypothetical protein
MKKINSVGSALLVGILFLPISYAQAANVKMTGFLDVVYVLSESLTNDAVPAIDSPLENKFEATGEVDIIANMGNAMQIRLDLDLNADPDPATEDSAAMEQAYFSKQLKGENNLTVKAGVFNNDLGWEKQDAPDMYQISHGLLYNVWDFESNFGPPAGNVALNGNNVAGVSVSANAGAVAITGALLNDISGADEESSFLFMANFSPDSNLSLEAGIATMDLGPESLLDINATNTKGALNAAAELMLGDEGSDTGLLLLGNYKMTKQVSGTIRYETLEFDTPVGSGDSIRLITFAVAYELDKDVFINAEISSYDDENTPPINDINGIAIIDGNIISAELIAIF